MVKVVAVMEGHLAGAAHQDLVDVGVAPLQQTAVNGVEHQDGVVQQHAEAHGQPLMVMKFTEMPKK